jgi:hypothetical protein
LSILSSQLFLIDVKFLVEFEDFEIIVFVRRGLNVLALFAKEFSDVFSFDSALPALDRFVAVPFYHGGIEVRSEL